MLRPVCLYPAERRGVSFEVSLSLSSRYIHLFPNDGRGRTRRDRRGSSPPIKPTSEIPFGGIVLFERGACLLMSRGSRRGFRLLQIFINNVHDAEKTASQASGQVPLKENSKVIVYTRSGAEGLQVNIQASAMSMWAYR